MTKGKLNTYILIGHVPVRPLSVGHDFPHDDPVAPHITSRGELPVLDSFGCSPSDRNLPSLRTQRATTSAREARPKPDRHSVLAPERDTVHCNNADSNPKPGGGHNKTPGSKGWYMKYWRRRKGRTGEGAMFVSIGRAVWECTVVYVRPGLNKTDCLMGLMGFSMRAVQIVSDNVSFTK